MLRGNEILGEQVVKARVEGDGQGSALPPTPSVGTHLLWDRVPPSGRLLADVQEFGKPPTGDDLVNGIAFHLVPSSETVPNGRHRRGI